MRFQARKTFERELRGQPEYQTALAKTAVEMAAAIRVAAEPARRTGYFIRRVVPARNRVHLRDPFWHLSEYGSAHNPPYAPARRGALSIGLRFTDGRGDGPAAST